MRNEVYINDPEFPLLAKYSGQATTAIAEIGCAYGASSVVFLAHCSPHVQVYSIDPFVTDSMSEFQATAEKCDRNVRTALRFLGREEKYGQWRLIPDYSYNVSLQWSHPLDLLFIDGDHRYDAVKRDFEEWIQHVKPGGFIVFHDSRKIPGTPAETFDCGWEGPTRVVRELSSDPRVAFVEGAFSATVLRKL
jgi:predicted O-methyltransferase YrrM